MTAYECHIYTYRARVDVFSGVDTEVPLQEGMAEIAEVGRGRAGEGIR